MISGTWASVIPPRQKNKQKKRHLDRGLHDFCMVPEKISFEDFRS